MNIEEAVEILKMWNKAEELVINESTDYDKTVYIQRKEAIETLLTAYEKEKEKNKELQELYTGALQDWGNEKEKNKELSEHADNLLGEKEYYQDCYDGITFKINNLISQIESAIDFMKTDKSKIKVDMYQQKEEDLKLEIVHLKKLLKEE